MQPVATPIPGDAGPGSQIRGRPFPPDFQRRLTWAREYSSEVLSRIEDAAYLGDRRELHRLVRTYLRSPQAKFLAAYKTQKQRRGDALDMDRVLEVSHAINVDDPRIEPSMFFTYKDGKHGIEMPAIAYGDVEHATQTLIAAAIEAAKATGQFQSGATPDDHEMLAAAIAAGYGHVLQIDARRLPPVVDLDGLGRSCGVRPGLISRSGAANSTRTEVSEVWIASSDNHMSVYVDMAFEVMTHALRQCIHGNAILPAIRESSIAAILEASGVEAPLIFRGGSTIVLKVSKTVERAGEILSRYLPDKKRYAGRNRVRRVDLAPRPHEGRNGFLVLDDLQIAVRDGEIFIEPTTEAKNRLRSDISKAAATRGASGVLSHMANWCARNRAWSGAKQLEELISSYAREEIREARKEHAIEIIRHVVMDALAEASRSNGPSPRVAFYRRYLEFEGNLPPPQFVQRMRRHSFQPDTLPLLNPATRQLIVHERHVLIDRRRRPVA